MASSLAKITVHIVFRVKCTGIPMRKVIKGMDDNHLLLYVFVETHRRVWFQTIPYDEPQNILFLYESSLVERNKTAAFDD